MFNQKVARILFAAAAVLGIGAGAASAQTNSDSTVITYEVQAVTMLDFTGGTASLTVSAGAHGSGLTSVSSTAVTYAVLNNTGTKKLVGKINTAMDTGLTLKADVSAPEDATSLGPVALTTSDQDLVTGVGNLDETGLGIEFTLEALVTAGVVASATKTFTMTVVVS